MLMLWPLAQAEAYNVKRLDTPDIESGTSMRYTNLLMTIGKAISKSQSYC